MAGPLINAGEYDWLKEHVKGRYLDELLPEFNSRFGRDLTFSQFRGLLHRQHLTSGLGNSHGHNARKLFTDEQEAWLYSHYKGTPEAELTRRLNEVFGLSVTKDKVKNFKKRHHLNSGLTGHFPKGHVPYNAGKKSINFKRNSGCFPKGNRPWNWKPVGSLRIVADNYVSKKIGEPNHWKLLQRCVWERVHGPIPKGYVILFVDGNRRHCSLDNLILVPNSVNARINQMYLSKRNRKIIEAAIALAELQNTIRKKRRRK